MDQILRQMTRFSLRQLFVFVAARCLYFGEIPHMIVRRWQAISADDLSAFAYQALLTWVFLAGVYIYWRQLTPLAVHCVCVALSIFMVGDPEVNVSSRQLALLLASGPCCFGASLISFPVSLALLALSGI